MHGSDEVNETGPLAIGDYVRWFPDAGDNRRYSDGWVVDSTTMQIASHGPRWSSKDGFIGDRKSRPSGRIKKIAKPIIGLGRTMAEFTDALREEFPDPVPVKHMCGRCQADLGALTDENRDAVVAAHDERCFVAGDWVRGEWNKGIPVSFTGEVAMKPDATGDKLGISIRMHESSTFTEGAVCHFLLDYGDLRRIPRPQQGEAAPPHAFVRGPESGRLRHGPPDETCAICFSDPRNDIHHRAECRRPHLGLSCGCVVGRPTETPAPVLYDGLDVETCYRKWSDNRDCVERGGKPLYAMTGDQIAAGRRFYTLSTYHEHAKALRAKLAASAESERNRVRVELQDVEELTW